MKSTHGTLTVKSPIGPLTLIARTEGLTHVFFPGHEGPLPTGDDSPAAAAALARAAEQLAEYFAGRRRRFDLPLAPAGTDFQRSVWQGLREIPYGTTLSYGELARRVGRPRAVRAVGAANGANPLPVIVPCHRVIGANGRLTGFGGGLPAKMALLELEGREFTGDRVLPALR
jgi:methylated-DNA-[protein]-cysteine S-methyltransferase